MKTESFKLIPSEDFKAEITRIAAQYPGFIRVSVTGNLHEVERLNYDTLQPEIITLPSLWINAWYDTGSEECITINAVNAETLTARFYHALALKFETDLIPVENF